MDSMLLLLVLICGVLLGILASIPLGLLWLDSQRSNVALPSSCSPQPSSVVVLAAPYQSPADDYDPYGGGQGYASALPEPVPMEWRVAVVDERRLLGG